VSGLWTPQGEYRPQGEAGGPSGPRTGTPGAPGVPGAPGAPGAPSPEEEAAAREQLRELRVQLANTPVADIIANHVIGLWELAVLHLTHDEDHEPDLEQAQLAIDAIGALVEGLAERLGQNEQPLRDALAQLRLAFVEISKPAGTGP
jgi:Domain of unknown function (DUF1844)